MGFARSKFMRIPGGIGTVTAMLAAAHVPQGADVLAEPKPAVTNQMPEEPMSRAERRRAEKAARKAMGRSAKRERPKLGRSRYEI